MYGFTIIANESVLERDMTMEEWTAFAETGVLREVAENDPEVVIRDRQIVFAE